MIRVALVAALALLLKASACRDASSPPTPTPSAQPTATPEVRASAEPRVTASPKAIPQGAVTPVSPTPPSATPTPLPRTRPPTGNPTADAAIAAIEARDVAALLALLHYELQQCVSKRDLGDPVECPPSVAPGTPLEVFAWSQCEGGGRPREAAADALQGWLDGLEYVYGTYRLVVPEQRGRAGIVVIARGQYNGGPHWGRTLLLPEASTGASWIHIGCLRDVEEEAAWVDGFGSVEPLGTVVP